MIFSSRNLLNFITRKTVGNEVFIYLFCCRIMVKWYKIAFFSFSSSSIIYFFVRIQYSEFVQMYKIYRFVRQKSKYFLFYLKKKRIKKLKWTKSKIICNFQSISIFSVFSFALFLLYIILSYNLKFFFCFCLI